MSQKKAGVILSYLSQAIQILTGIAYTPIMLRLLGQSEYGLYQLVFSVVSYLSLLSLGFGAAYMRFYSREKAKKDRAEIASLNGMFLTIFLVISAICILCGIVMLCKIELIFDTGLTAAEYKKARVLLALMVFNMSLTFPSSLFDCIVTAHEKFIFQKVIMLLQYVANPFVCLPLLLCGFGSISLVVVSTGLAIIKMVCNVFFCFQKLKVSFSFRGFRFGLLKEMWIFTFFIFLNQIIDQINWNVDKFLLGRLSSTVAVAVYGLGGQINSMYLQFSTAVSSVFVPKVNRIIAEKGEDKEVSELFTKVGRVQFIILGLVLSGFIIFGQTFMNFWGGAGYEQSYSVAVWLIIPVTVPLIQNLGIEIQRAKNMHKARSVVYFFIAIANIVMSIPLIKLLGPKGAAIGTAISLTIGNILFMNWYYSKRIGLDIVGFWRDIAKFIPSLIVPAAVGVVMKLCLPTNSLIGMIVGGMFYTMVYSCSMWFLGMNTYEKAIITSMIDRIRRGHGKEAYDYDYE